MEGRVRSSEWRAMAMTKGWWLCVGEKVVVLLDWEVGLGQVIWYVFFICLVDHVQFGNMGGHSQSVLQVDGQHFERTSS